MAPVAAIRIGSDTDLASFARDVLRLAEDPQMNAAIWPAASLPSRGRHARDRCGAPPQSHRIDKGVVTEAVIAKLGKGSTRLLLARRRQHHPLGPRQGPGAQHQRRKDRTMMLRSGVGRYWATKKIEHSLGRLLEVESLAAGA